MTLIQGAGVDWPGPRIVTYSRPSSAKPPSPLKNSRLGRDGAACGCEARVPPLAAVVGRQHASRLWHAIELIGEAPALSDEHRPRNRREQGAGLRRDQVGSQHEDAARGRVRAELRPRLARAATSVSSAICRSWT